MTEQNNNLKEELNAINERRARAREKKKKEAKKDKDEEKDRDGKEKDDKKQDEKAGDAKDPLKVDTAPSTSPEKKQGSSRTTATPAITSHNSSLVSNTEIAKINDGNNLGNSLMQAE